MVEVVLRMAMAMATRKSFCEVEMVIPKYLRYTIYRVFWVEMYAEYVRNAYYLHIPSKNYRSLPYLPCTPIHQDPNT